MKTTLYYYTATGNSLAIARAIANALGDTSLVPIARHRAAPAKPASERVGIIFPIHAWGPPRSVEEFLGQLDSGGARYCFALASCGGTAANALPRLRSALRKRGGRLDAGFIVRSAGYFVSNGSGESGIIDLVRRLSGPLYPAEPERLPSIIEEVRAMKPNRPERNAPAGSWLGSFFHGMAAQSFASGDTKYGTSDACTGCGACARLCPRDNIALEGNRPAWRHDCENCGICATWCPSRAITVNGIAPASLGHHPEIKLADMEWREARG